MRIHGTIAQWQEEKRFGLIEPMDGTAALFFHEAFLLHQKRRPRVGDTVSFEIATNAEGKRRAERILFPGERDPKQVDRIVDIASISLASFFFAGLGLLVYQKRLGAITAIVYLLASLLTFLLYWHDKRKAKNDGWRTPEKTLHLFSLAGGWPGALIAQRVLHHKSRKRSFRLIFATTILCNLVLVALCTIFQNDLTPYTSVSKMYATLRNQFHTSVDQQAHHKKKGPVYSWTNAKGKRVYSTVGFPENEPYSDGTIEWQ